MPAVLVKDLFDSLKDTLKLKLITPGIPLTGKIKSSEIHRPGLAFAGFYDYFASDCVQILGTTEVAFLNKQPAAKREQSLKKFFSYKIPCIVITKNQSAPESLMNYAVKSGIPIFRSPLRTTNLIGRTTIFIEDALAPRSSVHGTLLDVYGVGTLLMGKSGVGKSETALELVQRGQRLVADDVVEIKRTPGDVLMGYSSKVIRHHMEIRGLGIIDVMSLFGVGAVRNQKRILMAVTLEKWNAEIEYERAGLTESWKEFLGVRLPHLVIPIIPGRNIPVLVEVAALNQRLKRMGIHTAKQFNEDLIRQMAERDASD
ncbi:MAG: HPr(Ser) kinase/phosphatase [Candidatus Omnitrophica bacterium]|nr:HPr(Ser) kinase/phosphatase [Candidatus Omnitrophota bacterium]